MTNTNAADTIPADDAPLNVASNADMLTVYDAAHKKAEQYEGKSLVWAMLSVYSLMMSLIRGLVPYREDGKHIAPHQMTDDDAKMLKTYLHDRHKCGADVRDKALEKLSGTSSFVKDARKRIELDYRNKRNKAEAHVEPALAMARLATHWQAEPLVDIKSGKISAPAVWFMAPDACDAERQAMLPVNPMAQWVQPASTSAKAPLVYLRTDGWLSFQRERMRWIEAGSPADGEPLLRDFAEEETIALNAKGLKDAADALAVGLVKISQAERVAALQAERDRAAEQAKTLKDAAAANPALQGAADTAAQMAADVDKRATEEAAKLPPPAPPKQQKRKQATVEVKVEGTTTKTTTSAPDEETDKRQGTTPNPLEGNALAAACTLLRNAVSRDDYTGRLAPGIMEEFTALAEAMFRNETIADVLMEQRQKYVDQLELAAKLNAAKAAKAS